MPEFIFMLTHEDVTVENAFEVHGEIRDVDLRYVGFKDIGLSFDRLKALAGVIHECGQEVMLEVGSEDKRDELRSAQGSLDLGVDYLLGGTHAEEVAEILAGSGIRYCPFPGRVVGQEDRKSTRLNSSHANISYAVFCLKKKTKIKVIIQRRFYSKGHRCSKA